MMAQVERQKLQQKNAESAAQMQSQERIALQQIASSERIAMAQMRAGLQAKASDTQLGAARLELERAQTQAALARPPNPEVEPSHDEPAMAAALHAVAAAVAHSNRPKRIVRDIDGRAAGVEPAE